MAHPYAGQAKSSQQARLKRLGAKAGKAYGSSSMYKKTSYPAKGAGSSTPMTISGGSSKGRPDRMAAGGAVGGSGGKKRRPHATTNIIISHAGGRGGSGGGGGSGPNPPQAVPVPRPVPVPVNRPVPVPVGGGPPGAGGLPPGGPPPGAALPPRPPIAPPPAGPPPGAGLPMRPPGMAAGGAVKKAAKGGFLKETNSPKAGDAYPGFPHSPTTKAKSTVSAHAAGGGVKKRAGGGGVTLTKKLEFGGGTGLGLGAGAAPGGAGAGPGQAGPAGAANAALGAGPGRVPLPPQQGAPNVSGRAAIPFSQPNTVPLSGFGARNFSTRPAPGTTTSYAKKGGFIGKHDDEAQDKKLIKKMINKEEKTEAKEMKKASGGGVGPGLVGYKYRTNGPTGGKGKGLSPYSDSKVYRNEGKGYASGGSVQGGNVHGAGSALGRMARNNKVPAKTEL